MPNDPAELVSRERPIREDVALQLAHWRMERMGWLALVSLAVAALLGAFGQGPLSHVERTSEGGHVRVSHQRFARRGAPARLSIETQATRGADVRVRLGESLLDDFRVEGVQPAPLRTRSSRGGLEASFAADDRGRAEVRFALRPEGVGLSRGRIEVDGRAVDVVVFVYP